LPKYESLGAEYTVFPLNI